jgi:ParB/Sulfiredoxin domain
MRKATSSVELIRLADILPNPYRQIVRYAIDEEKIAALLQSYENSGFWDGSIQGRPSPKKSGKIEIAFGHHRIEAAKRKRLDAVGLVLADRSNADMLRMMADENRGEFKHDAWVPVETIAAVVDAYARGEIELEAINPQHAGGAVFTLPGGKVYSLATVARFLGWVKPSDGQATRACRQAFDAYRERAVTEQALNTLTPEERSSVAVDTVTTAARAARVQGEKAGLTPHQVRESEKRAAATAVKEIKDTSGYKAQRNAVDIGKHAVASVVQKKKAVPQIEVYTARLIERCEKVEPYADILTECYRLVPFLEDLSPALARTLASALERMLKRSSGSVEPIIRALRSGNQKKVIALLEKGA